MDSLSTQIALFNARLRTRIDPRITACSVTAKETAGTVTISGFTERWQTDAHVRTLADEVFGRGKAALNIRILDAGQAPAFYEVVKPWADFYPTPKVVAKDLLTQPLFGMMLRGYHTQGNYLFVRHPDGYVGFVSRDSVERVDLQDYEAWRNGRAARLSRPVKFGKITAPTQSRLILQGARVRLPGGRLVALKPSAYTVIKPKPSTIARRIVELAGNYKGTPYLWGGNTEKGIDCSGFVQSITASLGVTLPRDASMQAYVGEITGVLPDRSDLRPGDVIFFMNEKAYIHHVGLYLGGNTYIHSSGSKGVNIASFEPAKPSFIQKYHDNYVFGRRLLLP